MENINNYKLPFKTWLKFQLNRPVVDHMKSDLKSHVIYKGKEVQKMCETQIEYDIENPNIPVGVASDGTMVEYSIDDSYAGFNSSIIIVGGAGTGKTFRCIKPMLAQMNSSFIITDPSGEIMRDMGKMLLEHGYKVRLFSISDMKNSNCYNPFDYIYDAEGNVDQTKVAVLVSTFMDNADETKKGAKGGDDFWKKAPKAFMTAAVYYCCDFLPIEKRNMATILQLTQMGAVDEMSSSSKSPLDKLFEDAKANNPNSKAFSSYSTFKLAPARTANSILISLGVDLNAFSDDAVYNLTTTDYLCERDAKTQRIKKYIYPKSERRKSLIEKRPIRSSNNIDLDKIGNEKTAIFINTPQANGAYNFLISMLYSQLFDVLYTVAESVAPKKFHIYNRFDSVLTSMYDTPEDAQKMIDWVKNATIKEEEDVSNGINITRYFVYNEEAPAEVCLPEWGKGYIREVFSRKVGENYIKQHIGAYVKQGEGRLPIPTRFLLDEFANTGTINNFEKIPATCRKYMMGVVIVLQSIVQLEVMYDKSYETFLGNCATLIYLGSTEYKTQKYVSDLLGTTTIRTNKESLSKQTNSGSQSISLDKMQRVLMTPDEVGKVGGIDDPLHEIVIIGGKKFYLKKLNFADHPHFKESGNANKENRITKEYIESHFHCNEKHSNNAAQESLDANQGEVFRNKGGTADGKAPYKKSAVSSKKDLERVTGKNGAALKDALDGVQRFVSDDEEILSGMPMERSVPNKKGGKKKAKAEAPKPSEMPDFNDAPENEDEIISPAQGVMPEVPDFEESIPPIVSPLKTPPAVSPLKTDNSAKSAKPAANSKDKKSSESNNEANMFKPASDPVPFDLNSLGF